MESFKLEIPQAGPKNDLTIIYEEGKDNFHKVMSFKDDFLKTLRYFENKRNEINNTNLVYIQEEIQFDIFNDFIQSIQTKKIFINENNYQNYYYLSNKYEYKELKEEIEKFIVSRPDIISIVDLIKNSFSANKNDNENAESIDLEKEEIIAKNIDVCILNGSLKKLPLSMLIRILNSPKRQLKDHHLLFEFVKEIIVEKGKKDLDDNEKENLFILPSCLDYCLMNSNEIEELFEVEKSMPFFSPQNSDEKIKVFISREKEIFQKYSEIENKMKEIEQKYDKRIEILENLSKTHEKKISEEKTNFELFQNETHSKQTKNDEKMSEIDKKIKETQSMHKTFIETTEKQNKNIFERLQKLEKLEETSQTKQKAADGEIKNHNTRIQKNENSIIDMKKQIDNETKKYTELKSANENIVKEQKNIQNSILMIMKSPLFFEKDPKVKDCPNGIFKYLFDKYKENPVNKGLINIGGNSNNDGAKSLLPSLIDEKWTSDYWHSKDESDSYISIDFKNYFIKIYKYRLRVGRTNGTGFISNWVLKGITEDNREVILDEVNNSIEIAQNHPETTRSIQNHSIVRSIKLIMKGKSNDNFFHMRMRNIELFGYIKEN